MLIFFVVFLWMEIRLDVSVLFCHMWSACVFGAMLQNVQADYSMESHARDLDNYVNVARNRRRRAKALLDFERHDDDELGFRRNDIITVSCCLLLFWLALCAELFNSIC